MQEFKLLNLLFSRVSLQPSGYFIKILTPTYNYCSIECYSPVFTEKVVKTCRLSRSQQPFHLQNTTSRIKFVLEDYRYYTGYSVDYQIKLFDYIFYREKRGIDQTYDIIQSISYISAADGEVR